MNATEEIETVNRDWAEDAPHENGNYYCHCALCGNSFIGHKRRVVCRACTRMPGDKCADCGYSRHTHVCCQEVGGHSEFHGLCYSFQELRLGPRNEPIDWDEVKRQASLIIELANQLLREKNMHYRNGREAKNGDTIVSLGYDGGKIVAVGVLHNAEPGNDYCNGSIAPISTVVHCACMCDCLHMDDVAAMLKEKGLDKRPAGK